MPKHDVRAAPQPQKCRRQRGRAGAANKMRAAAGSVEREDSDVIVKGAVELRSVLPPQRTESESHRAEDVHRVYSSELLLAHRALSLRIARGAPGLEPDPAALARVGAGLQAVALPRRVQ